jgi:iron complex transport system substrate-binding protein
VHAARLRRIVCLTEGKIETPYLPVEGWRIVGISGFAVRPRWAREETPPLSLKS